MSKPKLITYQGESLSRQQWADRTGIPFQTIAWRHRAGMSPELILTPGKLHGKTGFKTEGTRLNKLANLPGKCGPRQNIEPVRNRKQMKMSAQMKKWSLDAPCPKGGHGSFLVIDGVRRSLAEWSVLSGLTPRVLRERIANGATPEEAIAPKGTRRRSIVTEPKGEPTPKVMHARRSMLCFDGRTMTVEEWARVVGVPFVDLLRRLNAGEAVEACLTATHHPQPVRSEPPQASPARPRMRVPTLAELDAMREAA